MTVNIHAKGFDLVKGTHEALKSELSTLNKIFGVDASYNVNIKKRIYGEYECSISTYIEPRNYTVKASRASIRDSIDAAVKAMKITVVSARLKDLDKQKTITDSFGNEHEISRIDNSGKITKTKEVHLTPISDAEAIEQLNDSDNDMFMYLDEKTLEVKGIYHRGLEYGVITFKTT